jgi:hypothetical protein
MFYSHEYQPVIYDSNDGFMLNSQLGYRLKNGNLALLSVGEDEVKSITMSIYSLAISADFVELGTDGKQPNYINLQSVQNGSSPVTLHLSPDRKFYRHTGVDTNADFSCKRSGDGKYYPFIKFTDAVKVNTGCQSFVKLHLVEVTKDTEKYV